MQLDQLTPHLPIAAVAAGALLMLWGQRKRLKSLFTSAKPAATSEFPMSAAGRFETFHALRTWCEGAGHVGAVKALDGQVLPAIVRGNTPDEGGSTS